MRCALTLAVFLLLAAPASAQLAPGELARVGHSSITKAEYDHWLPIAQWSNGESSRQDEAALRPQIMQLLISERWISAEAARFGITVSGGAVSGRFARIKRASFPREQDFQTFLTDSHQTLSDIRMRVRMDLLSDRITQHVTRWARTPKGRDRVVARFTKKFKARWRAHTTCAQGYTDAQHSCGTVVSA